ncbi:MAG: autotransporter domain-containing protein [Elusimicrobiota bacterium]|jgi:OOP family OmpA-OmpF porin|nr:autotransporter domain-containing protein [Elusimicrobiota bacterium]
MAGFFVLDANLKLQGVISVVVSEIVRFVGQISNRDVKNTSCIRVGLYRFAFSVFLILSQHQNVFSEDAVSFLSLQDLSRNQYETAVVFDNLAARQVNTPLSNTIKEIWNLHDEKKQRQFLAQTSGYFLANVIRSAVTDTESSALYDKIDINNQRGEIWTQIAGQLQDFKEDKNSIGKYEDKSFGVMIGVDGFATAAFKGGVFLEYQQNKVVQVKSNAKIEDVGFGLYAGVFTSLFEVKSMLSVTQSRFNIRRFIDYAHSSLIDNNVDSSFFGISESADVEVGLNLFDGETATIVPFVGIDVKNIGYETFCESADNPLALTVRGQNYMRSESRAGIRVNCDFEDWGWYAKGQVAYLLVGNNPEIKTSFSSTNLNFNSAAFEEGNELKVGAGIGIFRRLSERFSIFLNTSFWSVRNYSDVYTNLGLRTYFGKSGETKDLPVDEQNFEKEICFDESERAEVPLLTVNQKDIEEAVIISAPIPIPVEKVRQKIQEAKNVEAVSTQQPTSTPFGKTILKVIPAYFEVNSHVLNNVSKKLVREVIQGVGDLPYSVIWIEGHADSLGSDRINDVLSEKRARVVYDEFVEDGISKKYLSYRGLGSRVPISSNETEDGKMQNRRVEVYLDLTTVPQPVVQCDTSKNLTTAETENTQTGMPTKNFASNEKSALTIQQVQAMPTEQIGDDVISSDKIAALKAGVNVSTEQGVTKKEVALGNQFTKGQLKYIEQFKDYLSKNKILNYADSEICSTLFYRDKLRSYVELDKFGEIKNHDVLEVIIRNKYYEFFVTDNNDVDCSN